MPVVFLITIAAVLVGIFFAATGRGGELAYEHADHAPLDLGPVSAADVALLRPPTALWGYNMQVTDEALDRIARAVRDREVTIAYLQEQLASLARNGSYVEPRGTDVRQAAESPLAPEVPPFPEASEISETDEISETAVTPEAAQDLAALGFPQAPEVQESPQPLEAPDTLHAPPSTATVPFAEPPEIPQPAQTMLVLKASSAKEPPEAEPHEATQPSETLHDPEAGDATQPSETMARYETQGPQGTFDTHDWWAEQEKAAREDAARPQVAGPSGVAEDDSLAAAEEQGW